MIGSALKLQVVIALVAAALLLLGTACEQIDEVKGIFTQGPLGLTGGSGQEGLANQVFAEALDNFRTAQSYRFTVEAVHNWVFEGQRQAWTFTGEGAYSSPDNFYSILQGPADTYLKLSVRGGRVTALDNKGEQPNPSPAFGGPGVGAAPFTVVAYLRNYQQVSNLSTASLDGTETFRVNFTPKMANIAALDRGHTQAIQKVQEVQGQAWIDRTEKRIKQERVTVRYTGASGQAESVEMTLVFSDYNQPVQIK